MALTGSYLYKAGDVGYNIFFVSKGQLEISLTRDRHCLDTFGLTAMRVLLHKQHVHGHMYNPGDHFGEYCVLSQSGLRPDNALVLSSAEVFALDKVDLWEIFLYMTYKDRRAFLFDLFTRVGGTRHIMHNPRSDEEIGAGDERLKLLFRTANRVLTELLEVLEGDGSSSDSSSSSDEDRLHVRSMVRQQTSMASHKSNSNSSTTSLSQRDLLYLFDEIRPRSMVPSAQDFDDLDLETAASANPSLRRINRQVSVPDDISGIASQRRMTRLARTATGRVLPDGMLIVTEGEDDEENNQEEQEEQEVENDADDENEVGEGGGAAAAGTESSGADASSGDMRIVAHSRREHPVPAPGPPPTSSPARTSARGLATISSGDDGDNDPDALFVAAQGRPGRKESAGFGRSFMDSPVVVSFKRMASSRDRREAVNIGLVRGAGASSAAVHPQLPPSDAPADDLGKETGDTNVDGASGGGGGGGGTIGDRASKYTVPDNGDPMNASPSTSQRKRRAAEAGAKPSKAPLQHGITCSRIDEYGNLTGSPLALASPKRRRSAAVASMPFGAPPSAIVAAQQKQQQQSAVAPVGPIIASRHNRRPASAGPESGACAIDDLQFDLRISDNPTTAASASSTGNASGLEGKSGAASELSSYQPQQRQNRPATDYDVLRNAMAIEERILGYGRTSTASDMAGNGATAGAIGSAIGSATGGASGGRTSSGAARKPRYTADGIQDPPPAALASAPVPVPVASNDSVGGCSSGDGDGDGGGGGAIGSSGSVTAKAALLVIAEPNTATATVTATSITAAAGSSSDISTYHP